MIETLYSEFQRWSEGGSVYIISDPHFADEDCKLMNPNWPDPEEQVKLINNIAGKQDTLIILGDVGDPKYVAMLKAGYKVLITGNHDDGSLNKYRRDFVVRTYDKDIYAGKDAKEAFIEEFPGWQFRTEVGHSFHSPFDFYRVIGNNGMFDEVYDGPLFIAPKILLSHEPIELPCATNIHGHVHNGTMRYYNKYGCKCLNLASDVCDYKPINLGKEIKKGLLSDTRHIHRITIDGATDKTTNMASLKNAQSALKVNDNEEFLN